MPAQTNNDLSGLLDRIKDDTDGDRVTIEDLLDALGQRAFGSVLILTSLLAILPTGAIPGMSVITGTVMLLVSGQLAMGRHSIWLPGALTRRSIPRETLVHSLEKTRGWAQWVGRLVGPRLEVLVRSPFVNIVAGFGMLLSLTMFPLAVVPFGAFPASIAFLVIGVGLTVRDGLLIAIGIVCGAIGLYATWLIWPF